MSDFYNPYNFINPGERREDDPFCFSKPKGHDRLNKGTLSGSLRLKITTQTPLLVPDIVTSPLPAGNENKDHKMYRSRRRNGKPHLPITTLKGALRSAYEIVTNSRFGVLSDHNQLLGRRSTTEEGLMMVPARIVDGKHVKLYFGSHSPESWPAGPSGPPERLQYAAWLPMWGNSDQCKEAPEHGREGYFQLRKFEKVGRRGNVQLRLWEVEKYGVERDQLQDWKIEGLRDSNTYRRTNTTLVVPGYFCVTNQNALNKHHERVFFSVKEPYEIEFTDVLKERWSLLIENYKSHDLAKKALIRKKGREYVFQRSHTQVDPALSRHLYDTRSTDFAGHDRAKSNDKPISDGSGIMCYALWDPTKGEVSALCPVILSRLLHDKPPIDFFSESSKPATSYDQLSPADRVFGWVSQQKVVDRSRDSQAHKGQLRILTTEYSAFEGQGGEPFEDFGDTGLPLAILGAPKTEQTRFYLGDTLGNSQEDMLPKEGVGYNQPKKAEHKRVRGRKIYPVHRKTLQIEGYWDGKSALEESQSSAPRKVDKQYREYIRRPNSEGNSENRTDQNRSVSDWVKPGTIFKAEVSFDNLTSEELGGFLYLCRLESNRMLALGGGKPFGFGAVTVEIEADSLVVEDAEIRISGFRNLEIEPTISGSGSKESSSDPEVFIDVYKRKMVALYGDGDDQESFRRHFDRIKFIEQFAKATLGYEDAAVHYPRTHSVPKTDNENFKWFVMNEGRKGNRMSLPNIEDDSRLPFLPKT